MLPPTGLRWTPEGVRTKQKSSSNDTVSPTIPKHPPYNYIMYETMIHRRCSPKYLIRLPGNTFTSACYRKGKDLTVQEDFTDRSSSTALFPKCLKRPSGNTVDSIGTHASTCYCQGKGIHIAWGLRVVHRPPTSFLERSRENYPRTLSVHCVD